MTDFCYDVSSGNIMANDRHVVYWEEYCGGYYYFIKRHGKKQYLTQRELSSLAETVKWFTEKCGRDFGEPLSALTHSYLVG